MDPITIYTDVVDFRTYTEGLTADTTLAQLAPSIRTVASDINAVITKAAFEEIAGYGTEATDLQKDMKTALKTALANGAMYKYQIFSSTKKNGSDASLYKYQHEEIKDHYVEAYSRAMDELLNLLDEGETGISAYRESAVYLERLDLPLKNAREFDRYYGIGGSSFFFHKILFLIRSTWQYSVKPLMVRFTSEDTEAMELARRILAYRVIAQAVMQFDKSELPRCIRWDYNHEYTKDSDMQSRDKLAAQLLSQVHAWETSLDAMLKASSGAAIASDQNSEDNKFYMM